MNDEFCLGYNEIKIWLTFNPKGIAQLKLYQEPFFKFAFSDQRKIEKIHLPELKAHTNIIICKNPAPSKNQDDILQTGKTNTEGWVMFSRPLIVMPGDVFYAIEKEPSWLTHHHDLF